MSGLKSGPALTSLHDVELAAQAMTGERRAYGELVRRHGCSVRVLLRRMGAGATLADDLAQDAFLAGFERIRDFRGEGTFAAWIKRIAARLYLKRLKADASTLLMAETPEPEAPSPGYADRAGLMDLDLALRQLNPVERLCVSLSYGSGLSHTEVAESLSLPLGTVKSHVKRGLDKLRAVLAPQPLEGVNNVRAG